MPTLAGRAYIDVAYDPTSISKLRAVTAAEGNRMASSWNKTAGKLKSVGASLTRNVTLPLVAVGAVSVKVAADFDASLSKIQGLVGASKGQMEEYRKSILALAPAVAQGPTALADALYFVTSSGFKGAQALDILTASAKASTAGLGDTKTIADLVTSAMTAYGAKTLSAAQATDILVAATKAGKGDPAEFAAALQENVAAADTLGVSFSQLAAATAALSTVNSNVSQDATQLSGIFQAIIKPGPEAIKTLKQVGLSVGDLRKEVKDKGLLNTLLDLKKRFHGNVTEMGKLFPNVRGLRGFLTLVGKAAQRNVGIFDQVAHSTGSLNKAFKTALTNNPQVQFKKLTAQLQVLAIIVGETLIPVLLKLAGVFVEIANKFKGLSGGQQTFVLIAAGVLAAVGPLVSLGTAIGTLFVTLYKLAKALKVVTALQWLFNAALDANPIGLAIIALAALAVAFVVAYKKSATFRAIVHSALHAVAIAVDFVRHHWKLLLAVIPVIGPLLAVVATHFGTVKRIAVAALHAISAAINFVRNNWRSLLAVIPTIGPLLALVATHFSTFKHLAVSAFNAVKSAVHALIGVVNALVVGPIESLISALQRVESLAHSVASALSSIHVPGGGIVDTLKSALHPHTGGIVTSRGIQGYAGGGVVFGGVAGRDSVPAILTPGEVVLNESQQRALLHGGGAPVEVNVMISRREIAGIAEVEVIRGNRRTTRRVQAGRVYA